MKNLVFATVTALMASTALAQGQCPNLSGRYLNNANQELIVRQKGCESITLVDLQSDATDTIEWTIPLNGETAGIPSKYVNFITRTKMDLTTSARGLRGGEISGKLDADSNKLLLSGVSNVTLFNTLANIDTALDFTVRVDASMYVGSAAYQADLSVDRIVISNLQPNSLIGKATAPVLKALNYIANLSLVKNALGDTLRNKRFLSKQ